MTIPTAISSVTNQGPMSNSEIFGLPHNFTGSRGTLNFRDGHLCAPSRPRTVRQLPEGFVPIRLNFSSN